MELVPTEAHYTLKLDENSLKLYVSGLDSYIKIIAQQLLQPNSAVPLKNLMPQLISINEQLINLDKMLDEQQVKEPSV